MRGETGVDDGPNKAVCGRHAVSARTPMPPTPDDRPPPPAGPGDQLRHDLVRLDHDPPPVAPGPCRPTRSLGRARCQRSPRSPEG